MQHLVADNDLLTMAKTVSPFFECLFTSTDECYEMCCKEIDRLRDKVRATMAELQANQPTEGEPGDYVEDARCLMTAETLRLLKHFKVFIEDAKSAGLEILKPVHRTAPLPVGITAYIPTGIKLTLAPLKGVTMAAQAGREEEKVDAEEDDDSDSDAYDDSDDYYDNPLQPKKRERGTTGRLYYNFDPELEFPPSKRTFRKYVGHNGPIKIVNGDLEPVTEEAEPMEVE